LRPEPAAPYLCHFFSQASGAHPHLPSFPTRRSSDLLDQPTAGEIVIDGTPISRMSDDEITIFRRRRIGFVFQFFNLLPTYSDPRSEEHTSELQSRFDLVCRLLLEKKKLT